MGRQGALSMFDAIEALAEKTGILSLDLETTGLDPRNVDVLLYAMSAGFGNQVRSVAVAPTPEVVEFVVRFLKDPKMRVVGHNIFKFDLQVLHYAGVIPFGEIKAKIVDTLPLVWLRDENDNHGLKHSVKRYLRTNMTPYEEAYISSPALQQVKKVEAELKLLNRSLPKVVATARKDIQQWVKMSVAESLVLQETGELEKTTKKALLERTRAEGEKLLAARLKEIQEKHETAIEDLLGKKTAAEVQAQREQRAYARDDAYQTRRLYTNCRRYILDCDLAQWADMELQVRRISTEMEINGVYIDQERLERMRLTIDPLLEEFKADIYNLAKREFKISSPEQLAEVIYDDLGVPQIGGKRLDKKGNEIDEARSTKEAILARIHHPIAQTVLNYRALFKLKTAFIKKLSKQLEESKDGRIHPSYNTTVRTGRWSCKNPNVQQIPSKKKPQEYDPRIQDLGPHLRSVFVAPPGKKYIGGDLSQIELRLAAHFTEDYNLNQVYTEYMDHAGIRYYTGDIHDKTSKALEVPRKIAKNINFGLVYGMTAKGFARYARLYREGTNEFDLERAERFRDGFMELYSGIPDYLKRIQRERDNKEFMRTKFQTISGRFRRFPKEDNAFPGKIFNSIIQGSAADILKVIIWALDKYIVKSPAFAGSELIFQVHDEVGMYVPEKLAKPVAVLMKYIMEARWFQTSVPVLASVKISDDWGQKDDDTVPEVGILPPPETKIKPCVAMLTDRQREWASKLVEVEDFTFQGDSGKMLEE